MNDFPPELITEIKRELGRRAAEVSKLAALNVPDIILHDYCRKLFDLMMLLYGEHLFASYRKLLIHRRLTDSAGQLLARAEAAGVFDVPELDGVPGDNQAADGNHSNEGNDER